MYALNKMQRYEYSGRRQQMVFLLDIIYIKMEVHDFQTQVIVVSMQIQHVSMQIQYKKIN